MLHQTGSAGGFRQRAWPVAVCATVFVVCFLNELARHTLLPATVEQSELFISETETLQSMFPKKRKKIQTYSLFPESLLEMIKGSSILCFGDSLTKGLYVAEDGDWTSVHPYAMELARLLKNETGVVPVGVNGELTEEMLTRLPRELSSNPTTRAVIILGGTNDLGHRKPAKVVIDNIIALHKLAHNSSADQERLPVFTVAVTLPQARWPFNPQTRLDINEGIRQFVQSDCHVALLDIEDQWNQSVPANARFWSRDFVHFSPLGYDELGALLRHAMDKHIVPFGCPRSPPVSALP